MIHKITPSVDYNYWQKRLDTQLNEPTNQNLIKVPKIVKPMNKKVFYKTLGTGVINSPMSPPLLLLKSGIFAVIKDTTLSAYNFYKTF